MRAAWLVAGALSLIWSAAAAQSRYVDYTEWRTMNFMQKSFYIAGFIDGMVLKWSNGTTIEVVIKTAMVRCLEEKKMDSNVIVDMTELYINQNTDKWGLGIGPIVLLAIQKACLSEINQALKNAGLPQYAN